MILKDIPTRETVLPAITQWFYDNGYSTVVVESLSEVAPNDYVFSYRAWWSWDIAMHMRKAEMIINSRG